MNTRAIVCLAVAALFVTVVRAASNFVEYTYDAAGNIVAMQRANSAPIGIVGFAPTSGPIGTVVTISGFGFAPTPAGNTVAFNGVAATVTVASATALTVTVPVGASTGRIAVGAAGNAVASAQDFVVTTAGAPTISGFAPGAGAAGASVSVTGTNFDPAAGATAVKLNQSAATASTTTTTQSVFTVPAATGSGRIRVTTGKGTAVSDGDFIVPPGGIAASDIVASTRLVADGPAQSLGIFASNKYGLLLFDGNAGDWLSLQFADFAINPAGGTLAYVVYKPDNTQLSAGMLTAASLTIHVPKLPAAGTYVVALGTGIAQVSLDARLETNRVVPADGTTLAVARSVGQSTRALIAATAGEQKALMVSGILTLPAGTVFNWTIALPNGSMFRKGTAGGLGTTTILPAFTTTGTHTLLLVPIAVSTQTTFRLGLVTGVALAVDGAAVDVAIANPGEGARLNFVGAAGDNLGLGITGLALSPASAGSASVSVYKPDALLLSSVSCYTDGTKCSGNLAKLPVTGDYSVIVQPAGGATGALQAWLSHDVTGMLTAGTPFNLALSRPGQNGRLAFPGVAGALIAIQVRGVATSPAGQGIFVQINRPDGSTLAYTHVTGMGGTIVAPPLPVTGTYTVFLEPESAARGAATASMEVLLDPGQILAVDGPTLSSTIAVAGGSAWFTFAGAAGQNLGLGISNLALSAAANATISVYKPDATALLTMTCTGSIGRCGANLANLPVTGSYGIVVRPAAPATGSFEVTLSTDLTGTMTIGAAQLVNLDRPGRNARLTFTGAAGQTLRLSWSGVAIPGTTSKATVYVYSPSGSMLGLAQLAHGIAGAYDVPALPTAGDYTLVVDPPVGALMTATLTLTAR